MLKKPSIAVGVLIAAAAGTIATSLPAFSQAPGWGGGCCSSSRFFHHNKNRNWNGNEYESYNHIRLHIRNRNNNIAVARPSAGDRLREIRFVTISP